MYTGEREEKRIVLWALPGVRHYETAPHFHTLDDGFVTAQRRTRSTVLSVCRLLQINATTRSNIFQFVYYKSVYVL